MNTEYHYKARDQEGKLVEGELALSNAGEVAKELIGKGLSPVDIQEASKNPRSSWNVNIVIFKPKVTPKDMHLYCRQMFTMIKAGIPITNALKRLSESSNNSTLKHALEAMFAIVAAGQSLSTAMKNFPKVFPPLLRHIIDVGEKTGRLESSFKQVGDYISLEVKTLERLKSIMRYPMIVIIAICIAMVVVNIFVIPAFSNLFKSFGADLPIFTVILITISDFFLAYWWLLLALLFMGIAGARTFIKNPVGKWYWDRAQLSIPAVGPILEKIIFSRFSRTMVMIIRTGVPITQGIELVANAIGNEYYRIKISKMKDLMEGGDTLTSSAKSMGVFSPLALQMIMVGEDTGDLDDMMEEVAEYYEREIDYDIDQLGDVIEPMLLVFVGIMVLFLALGVFLPIWELGAAASG